MLFRKMTEADIPQVAAIEKDSFSQPWTEKSFRESLELAYVFFMVVEENDTVVGYCGTIETGSEADIINVAVKKEARNKGIASRMLSWLMEQREQAGIQDFTLEVRVGNAGAIHVYEKLGFVSEGIRPDFYEQPREDAMIMWVRQKK